MTRVAVLEEKAQLSHMRHRDLFDPAKHEHACVTMVGCGGVGSFSALAVAKLGIPEIQLIDHDKVEPQNIPVQLYGMEDLEEFKVEALADLLALHSGVVIQDHIAKLEEVDKFKYRGVVVSGLDSMEARQTLWTQKLKYNANVQLLIDVRLGGEYVRIEVAKPTDMDSIKRYEETLHSDDEAEELVCTAQGIIYVAFEVAKRVSQLVAFALNGETIPTTIISDVSDDTLLKFGEVKIDHQ